MPKWLEAEIVENQQWNERLFSLRIKASFPPFKAGQFARVGKEIDGEMVARPYSLVNSPDEKLLEIYFNIVPEGPLSPVLAKSRPGDKVKLAEKPNGFLTIDEIPECKYLWLFATGTGVGPFLSILKTDEPWQRFEKVVLVYSVRNQQELAYADLINELATKHGEQFCFIPCITRESVEGALPGRITVAIESGKLEQRAGIAISPDTSHVMMCGNSAMIAEASELLNARGLQRHRRREPGHITTEKYH